MEIDADFILGKIEMMRLRKICKNEKELKKSKLFSQKLDMNFDYLFRSSYMPV